MSTELETLRLDLAEFRQAVDRMFASTLVKPSDWQQCFRDIQLSAVQLYLDNLLVMKNLSALETIASESGSAPAQLDLIREKSLRERIQKKLDSSECWNLHFNPENSFSDLTGLRSRQDYSEKLALHLPEVYEESLRAEACTDDFLRSHSRASLAQIIVGLQHLSRNHIGFLLQTLEWVSDEDSWEELPTVPKAS